MKMKNKLPVPAYQKKKVIPKTAQDTIPFAEVYDNGLFLTGENTYSLIFAFENIDYLLIRDSEQQAAYEKYCSLINALPSDINYQEFIMNSDRSRKNLRSALIPQESSCELYEDYVKLQEKFIEESQNSSAEKILLGVMSYTVTSQLDNADVLFKYYREIQDFFLNLRSGTRQVLPEEVFGILYDVYHPFEKSEFRLPKDIFSRGGHFKDYIAPSAFAFRPKCIEIGNFFSRVLFLRSFDREISDQFLNKLNENNHKIIVSKHMRKYDKGKALELLRKEIFDVQEKVQKRKENNHKNGTDFIPFSLKERIEELDELQKTLSSSNFELFEISVFVMISAHTESDLDELTKYICDKAEKSQVRLETLVRQQEKGLNSVLPFGINHFNAENHNSVSTNILTDAAGVLLPFSSKTYFAQNGLNYGLNQITNDLIVLDRTEEMNSNGWILGTSGSGKSVFAKSEFLDAMFKYPDDEFIIIDPENEYRTLLPYFDGELFKLSPNSPTKMNIFDTDLSYAEDGTSAIALKSEFLMTVVETAKGTALSGAERSIIDRCVRRIYKDFVSSGGDKAKLPTLTDFYNLLIAQLEQEAADMAVSLELYVKGSFNAFAERTNIEINKKFLLIDIFEMGEQLRAVGLQVVLEFLWQRVIENKKKGVRTWIWIDEFSVMFTDSNGRSTFRSGEFFKKVYQRIRKHGGVITGITQNITEVLQSPQASSMLQNAEFCVLLQQKKEDLRRICEQFSLAPSQSKYLQSGKPGTGLIICGQKVIPFEKPLDKNNRIYKLFSTKFKEAI